MHTVSHPMPAFPPAQLSHPSHPAIARTPATPPARAKTPAKQPTNRFAAFAATFCSVVIAAVIAAGGIGGCYYPYPGGGGRAYSAETNAPVWPVRDAALALEHVTTAQAELIATAADMAATNNGDEQTPSHHANQNATPSASSTADSPWIIEPTNHGVVVRITNRENNPHPQSDDDLTVAFSNIWIGFYPNAYFHTSASTAQAASHSTSPHRFSVESGIPLRLPTAIPDNPRGLLIHYTALTGSDYERAVVQRFADEGWIVIDISTRLNVRAPDFIEAPSFTATRRRTIAAAANAAPRRGGGTWFVDSTTDTNELGRRIAHAVDDAIAENALAAEAAIEIIERRFPQTRHLDVAYIGFSAGALVGPAATERLRETIGHRLKAAIFIGGGGDGFSIADRSSTTIRSMRLHWTEGTQHTTANPPGDQIDEQPTSTTTGATTSTTPATTPATSQATPHATSQPRPVARLRRPPPHITHAVGRSYIRHSTLDPLHAISRLDGVRILIIDATLDAVVPPANANRLAAAAPKDAERWRFIGGHFGLFGYLPSQAPNLTRWLERAVSDRQATINNNSKTTSNTRPGSE